MSETAFRVICGRTRHLHAVSAYAQRCCGPLQNLWPPGVHSVAAVTGLQVVGRQELPDEIWQGLFHPAGAALPKRMHKHKGGRWCRVLGMPMAKPHATHKVQSAS